MEGIDEDDGYRETDENGESGVLFSFLFSCLKNGVTVRRRKQEKERRDRKGVAS